MQFHIGILVYVSLSVTISVYTYIYIYIYTTRKYYRKIYLEITMETLVFDISICWKWPSTRQDKCFILVQLSLVVLLAKTQFGKSEIKDKAKNFYWNVSIFLIIYMPENVSIFQEHWYDLYHQFTNISIYMHMYI